MKKKYNYSKDYNKDLVNKKQVAKIIRFANNTSDYIKMVSCNPALIEDKYHYINRSREELLYEINRMKINEHTMYRLLRNLDKEHNSSIKNLLFYILFNYRNDILTNILNQYDKVNTFLCEDEDGELSIYGFNYSKKFPQDDFPSQNFTVADGKISY